MLKENKKLKTKFVFNGLALFTGFYEYQYEKVISEKGSIKIGFGTGTLRAVSGSDADKDYEGQGLSHQLRIRSSRYPGMNTYDGSLFWNLMLPLLHHHPRQ